jgi:hypothetical protein
MLWWLFVAIGMGLFGTSYLALNMFSAGNIGEGLLLASAFVLDGSKPTKYAMTR